MNDEQLELASGYLDGEVTADERATIEADPALLAAVEQLRLLRSALADPPAPSDETRERAIAAALAAFDDTRSHHHEAAASMGPPRWDAPSSTITTADQTMPTNIIPFRRRRVRMIQGVSAVAAAALIAVAAGVVINRDDDNASTAREDQATATSGVPVPTAAADAPSAAPTNDAVGNTVGATTEEIETAEVSAPAPFAVEESSAATEPVELDAAAPVSPAEDATGAAPLAAEAPTPSTRPAASMTPATSMTPGTAAGAAVPTTASIEPPVLRTEQDLVDLAGSATAELPAIADVDGECAEQRLEPDAVYEDDDGTRQPVVVVLTDDRRELAALSLDDCLVVLRAPAP